MLIIGHRGAPTEALENSMDSFFKAIEAGVQRIECDIQLNQDHEPYIIHDDTLNRTSNGKGKLNQFNRSALQPIQLNNGESIPTLANIILKILPKVELNLELKEEDLQIVEATLKHVPKMEHRAHKIIFSSFSFEILNHLAQVAPNECIAVLAEGAFKADAITKAMKNCSSHIYHPDARFVSQDMMSWAKDHQVQVYPWISLKHEGNKEMIWEKLYNLGVDGLCTNYPREFSMWIKKRKTNV